MQSNIMFCSLHTPSRVCLCMVYGSAKKRTKLHFNIMLRIKVEHWTKRHWKKCIGLTQHSGESEALFTPCINYHLSSMSGYNIQIMRSHVNACCKCLLMALLSHLYPISVIWSLSCVARCKGNVCSRDTSFIHKICPRVVNVHPTSSSLLCLLLFMKLFEWELCEQLCRQKQPEHKSY